MEKIIRTIKSKTVFGDASLVKFIFAVLAGFLLSFGKMLGFPWSVNVAVCTMFPTYMIGIFAGSLGGYLLGGELAGGIVQLCSMLVIGGIRLISPFGRKGEEPIYQGLLCTCILMLFSGVMSVASGFDSFSAAYRMISAIISGCVVYSAKTLLVRKNQKGIYDLTGVNGLYIGLLYTVFIASMAAVPVGKLNLGRILAVTVLLLGVRKYKNYIGAAGGAVAAVGLLIFDPSMAKNTLVLAASGLITGAFAGFGSVITVAVFVLSTLVGLAAVGVNADTYRMLADVIIGSAIYVVVPDWVIKSLTKKISGTKNTFDIISQTTSSRLSFASNALWEIRQRLNMMEAAENRRNMHNKPSDAVICQVCGNCEMYDFCCKSKDKLTAGFLKLDRIIDVRNSVNMEDIRVNLPLCTDKLKVCEALNAAYEELLSQRAEQARTKQLRDFLINQLWTTENILGDLSFRLADVKKVDPVLSENVKKYFAGLGYQNVKATVYLDNNLSVRADIYLTAEFKGDLVKVTAGVGSAVDCDMDLPVITREKNLTRICFCSVPEFTADIGDFSASVSGEYSGDTYEIFDLSGGEKYVVFSDGMGTGKRARLDSTLAVSLLSRLIKSGMGLESAHKLVNSVLMVKGWEESFATLDVLRLDLNGGSGEFLKAGAAVSYLCRDGGVVKIGGQSFPAGILEFCPPDKQTVKLFEGDMLLMTSDGADEATAKKMAELAIQNAGLEAKEIVRIMGEKILEKKCTDDTTLILIKIGAK